MVWTRHMDTSRIQECTRAKIIPYLDLIERLYHLHDYLPSHICDMDETGYSIGKQQSHRVIATTAVWRTFKTGPGRQEWISVIEAVLAIGQPLPPLVITKAAGPFNPC
jgi:hypothetical protein